MAYDHTPRGAPSGHPLPYRVSSPSDLSDLGSPYDGSSEGLSGSRYSQGSDPTLSIDTAYHGAVSPPSTTTPTWPSFLLNSNAYRRGNYSPVAVSGGVPPRYFTNMRADAGRGPGAHITADAAGQETYDMPMLPKGSSGARNEAVRRKQGIESDENDEGGVPEFDFTVSLGPMSAHDAEFIRKLQEQEAKGKLTGGLGQGFRAEDKLHGADLLTLSGSLQSSKAMPFVRRMQSKRLSRAETIRHMGQDAANRRGKVIEVIMEDDVPAEADLSHLEGPDMLAGDAGRARLGAKERVSRVFYPQPNWKPLTMQWPYLTALVVLSLGLGVMQEVLYRRYSSSPILVFTSPNEIDPGRYFAVKFAPTLSAVVYGVLWQFTDFDVRRLEAFYQLSKRGGASAGESISLDYATGIDFIRPFRALRRGHHAVMLSSIATTLAVSLVPTFAAASVVLTPGRAARMADPDGQKTLDFSPLFSRLLTATLVVIAVFGIVLVYLLQGRRSGLLSDVKGIAGLASMAVVSHILMDFKGMDTALHDDIHNRLKYKRYVLRNSSLAPYDDYDEDEDDDERGGGGGGESDRARLRPREQTVAEDHDLSPNPHPLMLRKAGLIPMIAGLVLFTGFIPAFLFSPAIAVTDKAPWAVTAMAVGLRTSWGGMESSVRLMEPYYILSKRHAPPKTLVLDYTAMPFGWMPLRALLNRHVVVFLVGFGSVMAEFLTILVSGLATVDGHDFLLEYQQQQQQQQAGAGAGVRDRNGGSEGMGGLKDGLRDAAHQINAGQETVRSFYVSVVLSMFILLYMSSVATWVLLSRRHPFLARQPNTIASVLAYIHQSKMLYRFVGTSRLSSADMVRKLEAEGAEAGGGAGGMGMGTSTTGTTGTRVTYGLGWFVGRDGQKHCGVDEEEMISGYKHGIDFLQGIQPWNTQWDVL